MDPSTRPLQTGTGQGQASRKLRVSATGPSGIGRGFMMMTPGPRLQAEPPGQKEQRAAVGKGSGRPGLADRPRLRAEAGGPGAGGKVWGQQGQAALTRRTLPQEAVGETGQRGGQPRSLQGVRAAPALSPGPALHPRGLLQRPGPVGRPRPPASLQAGPFSVPTRTRRAGAVGLHAACCSADHLAGARPGAEVKGTGEPRWQGRGGPWSGRGGLGPCGGPQRRGKAWLTAPCRVQ